MIDSTTTTADTTIATIGREILVCNGTGLGTNEGVGEGVDEEGVDTGELRLGATKSDKKS